VCREHKSVKTLPLLFSSGFNWRLRRAPAYEPMKLLAMKPERKKNTMKAEIKNEEKVKRPGTGRAAYIHELKQSGVEKADALTAVREKFPCSLALLGKVWDRRTTGQQEAKATPEPKPEAQKQKKQPAKKKGAKK
jgi:hypothetical protein